MLDLGRPASHDDMPSSDCCLERAWAIGTYALVIDASGAYLPIVLGALLLWQMIP